MEEKPNKLLAVGIFLAQSSVIWVVLVGGCIIYDHFNRPWNTPQESFRSMALAATLGAPFFCFRIRRAFKKT